jgi:hypothetical protein
MLAITFLGCQCNKAVPRTVELPKNQRVAQTLSRLLPVQGVKLEKQSAALSISDGC